MKRLLNQCRKELSRWKNVIQVLDHEELVATVLNITLYQVYKRNKKQCQSVKFSDYLKEEPYLDHYLYRVCRELETNGIDIKKRIYARRGVKKFGVFDVQAVDEAKAEQPVAEPEKIPWDLMLEK